MTPEEAQRRRAQRLRAEENVQRIARGEEPLSSTPQKPPIRPGLYRNRVGVQLRVIENANPQFGPYQILGNIWLCAIEQDEQSRPALATTEFLQDVYDREEEPAAETSEGTELECERRGCMKTYRMPYPKGETLPEPEYVEHCAYQFGWTSWEDKAGTVTHYCTEHFPLRSEWRVLRKRW